MTESTHSIVAEGASGWGEFTPDMNSTGLWQLGPLSMWIKRVPTEWQIATWMAHDPIDPRCTYEPNTEVEPPPEAKRIRCAPGTYGGTLRLMPALADRPVVVRPEQPLAILPGDEAVLYVGSPLWATVRAGEPTRTLAEFATFRLSDTWFGTSTRSGELCYASRTRARLNLDDLPVIPARAITRIRVHNRGESSLLLERVKVPLTGLSLFSCSDGRYWTQGLEVEWDRVGQAEVQIVRGPPDDAGEAERVNEPRSVNGNAFQRALGALVG